MILVSIEVPSLGRDYQFSLDESSSVELILDEVIEMICQKEHGGISDRGNQFCLCSKRRKRVLEQSKTLEEQGVTGADRLILL